MRTAALRQAPRRRRRAGIAAALTIFAVLLCRPALADTAALRGVALVVGQSDYAHLDRLENTANDARAVEELLAALGFETDVSLDRDARRLKRDLDSFIDDAEGADVALLYYAGHGIEAGGANYLIPVDADPAAPLLAGRDLVDIGETLAELRARARITIILLDACRTNPFPPGSRVSRADGEGAPLTLGARGLVATRGVSASAPATGEDGSLGEVIAYAAAPGEAALDGVPGANSPYAAALVKHLPASGLDFGQVMTLVTEEVHLATRGQQRPWTNASLRRILSFGGAAEEPAGDEATIRTERRRLLLTIAATPAELRRQALTIADAEEVPLDAVFGMLSLLGVERTQDPSQMERQLKSGAGRLKQMLAEREALAVGDQELARLSGLADRAIAEGALTAATGFYQRAKARMEELDGALDAAEEQLKARRLEFAALLARSAEAGELAFAFRQAAEDWAQAREQAERWDTARAARYHYRQALALAEHGQYAGDDTALNDAARILEDLRSTARRNGDGALSATLENDLGNARNALGNLKGDPAVLKLAIGHYRAAASAWDRTAQPLDWAMAQNNLGTALKRLAAHEAGTGSLEAAAAAYRAALGEWRRETAPFDWAAAQNNLGNVLVVMAERGAPAEALTEAVAAYRLALTAWTREAVPLDWAAAQNNLGLALKALGLRTQDAALLREASASFEAALEEWPRALVPLQWASAQNNLGSVLMTVGRWDQDQKTLARSAQAFRDALQENTRARAPFDWALMQSNLGATLAALGDLGGDVGRYGEAAAAYREALEEITRERSPVQYSAVQTNLGNALTSWGERGGAPGVLEDAVLAYEQALAIRDPKSTPVEWAVSTNGLGWALKLLGESRRDKAMLARARAAIVAAATTFKASGYDLDLVLSERVRSIDAAMATID